MLNNRTVNKQCGDSLVRPYINDQVFSKMYNLSKALEYGTIFPELNLWDSPMYNKDLYKNISSEFLWISKETFWRGSGAVCSAGIRTSDRREIIGDETNISNEAE